MTQNEAIQTSLAVITAMIGNDKEAREEAYANLTEDELKRVLRWTIRQFITHFVVLAAIGGRDPIEAWQAYCNTTAIRLGESEDVE